MTMKHSPGPWKVAPIERSAAYGSREVTTRNNGLVAIAWSGFKGEQAIADANARLIAAAPELLAAAEIALQLIRDTWIEDHGSESVGEAWGALERAIAKARP